MTGQNHLLERAHLLLQQRRFKDAETTIRQLLEQEPRNDEALALLGRCYLNNNKIDEGIRAVKEAITIAPNTAFYFYLLGFGYYQKSIYDTASQNLWKAINLNPYEPEYFGLLAFVHLEKREFEAALNYANKALELDAQNLTALNARSTALTKLRRNKDAYATIQDALARDPDNEMTHTTAGWNLLEKGSHRDAEKHFMEALRLSPNYRSARNGLKESLKSRVLPYKWLLQYSFWIRTKSRRVQRALPFILYIAFRVLVAAFRQYDQTQTIAAVIAGVYVLFLVFSWTINPLANFFLYFHPRGKYALSHSEKWQSITVVAAVITGLAAIVIGTTGWMVEQTPYEQLLLAGMVALSLALPLGRLNYPLKWQMRNREWMLPALLFLGLASLVLFVIAPGIALPFFVVYGIAFVIYTWIGAFNS